MESFDMLDSLKYDIGGSHYEGIKLTDEYLKKRYSSSQDITSSEDENETSEFLEYLNNNSDNDEITNLIIDAKNEILLLKDVYELISYASLYILIFITLLTMITYIISRIGYFNWKHSICYISKDSKFILTHSKLHKFSKF